MFIKNPVSLHYRYSWSMKTKIVLLSTVFVSIVTVQNNCSDIQPDDLYTCQQQKNFGQCDLEWMLQGNYCAKTCGRCIQDFACGPTHTCAYGQCDDIQCPSDDCNAHSGELQGQILILDYNSFRFHGIKAFSQYSVEIYSPQAANPGACCDICKQTAGCNAWVFCNNQDGCGEGCQEYIDGLPYQNVRDVFFPDIPIPYETFGQYGSCQGTRWPQMMCSLRAVSDSENPQTVQSDQNEWVSGILNPFQDCQGHSWAVCDICQSAYDIDACYQCASQVPVGEQQHCGKCSALSSTALQRRCIECLKAGSEDGCGQCVNLEEEYIKACFECSLGEEDIDVQNGCFACWAYGEYDPDCVQKCVKAAEVPGHAKQECGWCDLSDIGTQRCFQCLQESAESPTECWRCSAEECFSCLSEFSLNTQGRQGCISCTDRNKADCYKCVSDSNVPDYAKKLCGKVEYARDSLARRNAHYNCLAGAPTTEAAEMCFYCSLTDENAERCYECSTILNAARKDTEYCTRCARENTEDERNVCYECVEYEGLDVELIPQCFKCLGYRLPGEGIEKAQECINCLFNAATVEEADDCF